MYGKKIIILNNSDLAPFILWNVIYAPSETHKGN